MKRRCYHCDHNPATYQASVAFDHTPEYLLCVACAADLRAWDDVITIHTIGEAKP